MCRAKEIEGTVLVADWEDPLNPMVRSVALRYIVVLCTSKPVAMLG